jgi:protein subunit release factor A
VLIQQSEGELGELALEELCVCRKEIERLKVSLVNAVIPQDEADQHSAVLELRPGMNNYL